MKSGAGVSPGRVGTPSGAREPKTPAGDREKDSQGQKHCDADRDEPSQPPDGRAMETAVRHDGLKSLRSRRHTQYMETSWPHAG
jgi:hypothetical protein